MEKKAIFFPGIFRGCARAFALLLIVLCHQAAANNPSITNLLTNLSMGTQVSSHQDHAPEMIISGNYVHALWTTWVGNNEGYLFYCRSVDNGVSWEQPRQIFRYNTGGSASEAGSRRLAVSGNHVYIAICDYNYYSQGTGYIYLTRSDNNGETFTEPVELANSGGGFSALSGCYIRADGNKVAIVYRDANYNDAFEGLYCLFSGNNGSSFTKTSITSTNTSNISDFLFDGDRLVVLHAYAYYYYGLNVGRVYVSVSANDGQSFTTHKISPTYTNEYGEQERCLSNHDTRYVAKLAKDGNHIHAVFVGNNSAGVFTLLYARSTDNGQSFSTGEDLNNGHISNIQNGQESLVAAGGNVYISYLSTSSKVYLVRSDNNGSAFSEPADLLTSDIHYIKQTWWPQLVIDQNDVSGQTLYFGSGAMMTRKSVDGGESFSGTLFMAPIMSTIDVRATALHIDNQGQLHWLAMARWTGNNDFDIFYGAKRTQPDPGPSNKAYSIETLRYEKYETTIVPASPSLAFDVAMTGEAWIKMRPGSSNVQNVFSKIMANDGAFYQGTGYHMYFDDNYGKRRFSSGVMTDKGDFINWTNTDLRDTLWHHVAITYDADGGLNNFKSYLDGVLIAQQTVTGIILPGDGILLIGSRSTMQHYNSNYMLDDVRLWNRALTQEELQQNQVKAFSGDEEGLVLWLNFDDTFKDMSGHGNDAIPLYLGEMQVAGFDPPVPDFDVLKERKQISLNNKTTNASAYLWDFGNNNTSVLGNPTYLYPLPGEYLITLSASNANCVTSRSKSVSIEGLEKISPESAGNFGRATVNIFGGGLSEASQVVLRRAGQADIAGTNVYLREKGVLSALFDVHEAETGSWDVVVTTGGTSAMLENAFHIVAGSVPQPWVDISGRMAALINTWSTTFINFGNNGNNDLRNIPIFIAISDIAGLEVEFIDFGLELDDHMLGKGLDFIKDSVSIYFVAEDFFGPDKPARIFPLVVQSMPQQFSGTMSIRVKSPETYDIWAWTYGINPDRDPDNLNADSKSALWSEEVMIGFFDWDVWTGSCMRDVFVGGLWDLGGSIASLLSTGTGFGCAKATLDAMISSGWSIYEGKPDYKNALWDMASVAVNCAADQIPAVKAYKLATDAVGMMMTMYANAVRMYNCIQSLSEPIYSKKTKQVVGSFDPNEIAGPQGYGPQNFIRMNSGMPYSIFFENKSTATAPAHIVTITDTLNLNVFDISNFGFEAFGWGDTIIRLQGNGIREFSRDIDLRPGLALILRVSGWIHEDDGTVHWSFLSLNPETMEIEEDPFIGFLPPNALSPEGEGFVSFRVGLKDELTTYDEVRNQAIIIFDANEPIITNEYLNTLDRSIPDSRVGLLGQTTPNHFLLTWSGEDIGAGISHYTIFVLENDTLLYPWLANTTETSALFSGQVGSTYKFYSIAMDNVGHIEATPATFDAWTTLTVDVPDYRQQGNMFSLYPNPARQQVTLEINPYLAGEQVKLEIYNVSGANILSRRYSTDGPVVIDLSRQQAGVYFVHVTAGGARGVEKLIIY